MFSVENILFQKHQGHSPLRVIDYKDIAKLEMIVIKFQPQDACFVHKLTVGARITAK